MYKVFAVILTLAAISHASYPLQYRTPALPYIEQTNEDSDIIEQNSDDSYIEQNNDDSYIEKNNNVPKPPTPYKFGYSTLDGFGTQTTRQEASDASGAVKGSYSYYTALGIKRVVNYASDVKGFRAVVKTNEPGTISSRPANVIVSSSPLTYLHTTPKPIVTPSRRVAYTPVYPTTAPIIILPPNQYSRINYPTKSVTQSSTRTSTSASVRISQQNQYSGVLYPTKSVAQSPAYTVTKPTPVTKSAPVLPVTYQNSNPTQIIYPTVSYPISNRVVNRDYAPLKSITYPTKTLVPLKTTPAANPVSNGYNGPAVIISQTNQYSKEVAYPTKSAAQLPSRPPAYPVLKPTPTLTYSRPSAYPVSYPINNPVKPALSYSKTTAYPVSNPTVSYPISNLVVNTDYAPAKPTATPTIPLVPVTTRLAENPVSNEYNRPATKSNEKQPIKSSSRRTAYSSPARKAAQVSRRVASNPISNDNYYPTKTLYPAANPTAKTQGTSTPADWSLTYPYFNPTRKPSSASSWGLY